MVTCPLRSLLPLFRSWASGGGRSFVLGQSCSHVCHFLLVSSLQRVSLLSSSVIFVSPAGLIMPACRLQIWVVGPIRMRIGPGGQICKLCLVLVPRHPGLGNGSFGRSFEPFDLLLAPGGRWVSTGQFLAKFQLAPVFFSVVTGLSSCLSRSRHQVMFVAIHGRQRDGLVFSVCIPTACLWQCHCLFQFTFHCVLVGWRIQLLSCVIVFIVRVG